MHIEHIRECIEEPLRALKMVKGILTVLQPKHKNVEGTYKYKQSV
jgi:hypothetical protein